MGEVPDVAGEVGWSACPAAGGGWWLCWFMGAPVVEHVWSGPVTIEALKPLRAHGREL
ncbi:hypothetical protein [Actinokineospora sp. UTMC 2448]|uniref:hypothetical protein n=1 Tax=Actinokineospora sp. UTMC 2448 TaxID=2268449 RepID=UPI002164E0A2|nr:hypothetical protein [Actinokineospora sp. UTMC 2448]